MNDLQVFNNPEFKTSVRAIREPDGSVLFVGSDVASLFGYAKPQNAIKAHCRCALKRGIPHPQNPDKEIEVLCIPQGDVIRRAANSKLPGAAKFESWIFDEVIPQVLHTGSYAVQQPTALTALEQTVEVLKEMDTRITTLETKQAALEQAVTSGPKDWLTTTRERIEGITGHELSRCGLFLAPLYAALEEDAGVNLALRQTKQFKRLRARGEVAHRSEVSRLWLISLDDRLKAAFDRILDRQEAR